MSFEPINTEVLTNMYNIVKEINQVRAAEVYFEIHEYLNATDLQDKIRPLKSVHAALIHLSVKDKSKDKELQEFKKIIEKKLDQLTKENASASPRGAPATPQLAVIVDFDSTVDADKEDKSVTKGTLLYANNGVKKLKEILEISHYGTLSENCFSRLKDGDQRSKFPDYLDALVQYKSALDAVMKSDKKVLAKFLKKNEVFFQGLTRLDSHYDEVSNLVDIFQGMIRFDQYKKDFNALIQNRRLMVKENPESTLKKDLSSNLIDVIQGSHQIIGKRIKIASNTENPSRVPSSAEIPVDRLYVGNRQFNLKKAMKLSFQIIDLPKPQKKTKGVEKAEKLVQAFFPKKKLKNKSLWESTGASLVDSTKPVGDKLELIYQLIKEQDPQERSICLIVLLIKSYIPQEFTFTLEQDRSLDQGKVKLVQQEIYNAMIYMDNAMQNFNGYIERG